MAGAEDTFVARLAARLGARSRDAIGDDAGLVAGRLVTTDVLVEGVDFRPEWGRPADLGWKAVAVNLSDIAAMAGCPEGIVVAVVLGSLDEAFWTSVYDGVAEAAASFDIVVAGGDVSAGPAGVVAVTAIGRPGPVTLHRSGAKPGDVLYV